MSASHCASLHLLAANVPALIMLRCKVQLTLGRCSHGPPLLCTVYNGGPEEGLTQHKWNIHIFLWFLKTNTKTRQINSLGNGMEKFTGNQQQLKTSNWRIIVKNNRTSVLCPNKSPMFESNNYDRQAILSSVVACEMCHWRHVSS